MLVLFYYNESVYLLLLQIAITYASVTFADPQAI